MRLITFIACLAATGAAAASVDPPTMLRIAYAGDDGAGNSNSIAVQWTTVGNTTASVCQYGTTTKLGSKATGTQAQYFSVAPQGRVHHTVTLGPDLTPATTYFYSCAGSATRQFVTPPRSADVDAIANATPLKIAVYGDMGTGKDGNAVSTRRALEPVKEEFDFFWHLGDISYADDALLHTPTKFEYEHILNEYQQWMANISDHKPYMTLPVNFLRNTFSDRVALHCTATAPDPHSC